jgi:hypothetical protein
MLKLIWFIPRPVRDIDGAEALYQGQHVRRGMRQENLRAFRISRALFPQPQAIRELNGSDEPASFRFSEGYWDTFEDVQECYRSPNGLAALADGMLNANARIPSLGTVFFAEEQEFPASSRILFDPFRGAYAEPHPTKLVVFTRLPAGKLADFDARYAALAPAIGKVAGLGPHILSRRLDLRVELGTARSWPADGTELFDRVAEFYFPDEAHLDAFVASPEYAGVVSLCQELGERTIAVAVEPQEVFFTTLGQQPIPPGLRSLYADSAG